MRHHWQCFPTNSLFVCLGSAAGDAFAALDNGGLIATTDMSADFLCEVEFNAVDSDSDKFADFMDVCPSAANPTQIDADGDGYGWACARVHAALWLSLRRD